MHRHSQLIFRIWNSKLGCYETLKEISWPEIDVIPTIPEMKALCPEVTEFQYDGWVHNRPDLWIWIQGVVCTVTHP